MASSASLGPCLALAAVVCGIGGGPYLGRRLFEGQWVGILNFLETNDDDREKNKSQAILDTVCG